MSVKQAAGCGWCSDSGRRFISTGQWCTAADGRAGQWVCSETWLAWHVGIHYNERR